MRHSSLRGLHLLFAAGICLTFSSCALAQVGSPSSADEKAIRAYIAHGWDSLSRSMSDCKSVVDAKVTTTPVMYLPEGMATPSEIKAMQAQCKVEVKSLPRVIHQMGDVKVAEIPREGLLYLPKKYVVPGGRFNEMYGWDSYFIILGLVEDGHAALARGMVENFFFEIENYGALLNANRTYFFTRSQPPLLTSMIRSVLEEKSATPHDPAEDRLWLARAYEFAQRDYALWTGVAHRAGTTGLARYKDIGDGPVPEMADDSSYYPDVIRWLEKHPEVKTSYLMKGSEKPTGAEAATLAKTSCDVKTSVICLHAVADGHRLTKAFFLGDRAMRESGFDTSFRFGPFSGSTDQFAPVCLNSLLYKYEIDMAEFARQLGKVDDEGVWTRRARQRKAAMNRYLWNAAKGLYYDYNFVTRTQSTYNFASVFYPLWSGAASKEQASAVAKKLNVFEHAGGLAMSDNTSGTQWDAPFGWAPNNWFAVAGLEKYGYDADARRLSKEFTETVLANFKHDGTIREKYNMVEASGNVAVAAGYKSNVIGFGWTNGVYVQMMRLLATPKSASAAVLP